MSLIEKIKSNKKFKDIIVTDAESKTVNEFYHCGSITLNLLLSGKVNGGIPAGKISQLAAPRAHFKTIIAIIAAGNAQKKGNQVVWIDSEFAFDSKTAKMFGMDLSEDKFLLIQESSIENVQSFALNLFEDYTKKEDGKIFVVVDSLGTMITSKTIEDSLEQKDTLDLTESKKKNKLSKILLRLSGMHDATIILINHLYAGLSMYDTGVIGGGSSSQYVASSILKITSRAKEKDKEGDVEGNIFTANTEKGRLAKENSKLKFRASYREGINLYYGLLEDAMEGGYVDKPSNGWYARPCLSDEQKEQKFREKDLYTHEFWKPVFQGSDFKQFLETRYSYSDSLSADEKVYDMVFDEE